MSSTTPLRHPDVRSPEVMARRAWILVALNFLLPGSGQVLAGDRRLGRLGLRATFLSWFLVLVLGVLAAVRPAWLVAVFSNPFALGAAVVIVAAYGVLWLVLTLDTLRLVRFVRLLPSVRGIVAAVAVAGLVLSVGGAGFAAVRAVAGFDVLGIFDGGQIAEPIDGRYNILLLGGDAGPDRMGLRPDSITVASVDAVTGAVTMIGVPRNLEDVPFPADSPLNEPFPGGYDCGEDCLVSYLYTYGQEHPELYPDAVGDGSSPGVEAMRDAVEGITGLTMQYYVLIDMQGFVQLIDALGGVDITVEERLPIGGDVRSDGTLVGVSAWVEAGPQHMDGNTALWYARSRHSTNDYDRMQRQRVLQEAILRQFDPANVLLRFQGVAAAGAQTVSTDIPQTMLGRFTDLALLAKDQPITRLELTPPLVETDAPDFGAIRALVAAAVTPATATPAP